MAWQPVGGEFRGDWVVVRAVDYLRVVIAQEGEKKPAATPPVYEMVYEDSTV